MPGVSDDWRVTIRLEDPEGDGLDLVESMREAAVEDAARERLGDRVVVSAEGPRIFLYADTEERSREAEQVVRDLLGEHRLAADEVSVTRWHPLEEQWEDAAIPLPATDKERRLEELRRDAAQEADTAAQGYAEWEVRSELPSHRETVDFAERLEAEGLPVVRRWKYLLVGAASEDDARALAERLRAEAPPGTRVETEASGRAVWEVSNPNPFAIFGGLGG